MKAYQLKITLKNSHPPIWRRCLVPQGLTFSQLAVVLNISMGWSGSHLSGFDFPKQAIDVTENNEFFEGFTPFDRESIEADKSCIDTYVEGEPWFTYTYDFGDDWEHKVVVEKVLEDYTANYPTVIKYKGDCPPDDCGGIYAFSEFLREEDDDAADSEMLESVSEQMNEYCLEDVNEDLKNFCFLNMDRVEKRNVAEIYEDLMNGKFGFFAKAGKRKANHLKAVQPGGENTELAWAGAEQVLEDLVKRLKRETASKGKFVRVNEPLPQALGHYGKADLLDIAKSWSLEVKKSFSKKMIIENLTQKMLEPGVLEKYFLCLSDLEMASLQRTQAAQAYYVSTPTDDFYALYNAGYIFQDEDGSIYLSKEVADFYGTLKDPAFQEKRERQQWLLSCINAANVLYGITPFSVLTAMFNRHGKFSIEQDELVFHLQDIPLIYQSFALRQDGICADELQNNAEAILQMQDEEEYYLPSRTEVLMLRENPVVTDPNAFNNLVDFLQDTFGKKEAALAMSDEIWHLLAYGMMPSDIHDFLQLNSQSMKMTKAKDSLFLEKINLLGWHTRTLMHRGFTPEEIFQRKAEKAPKKNQGNNVVYLKNHQKK